MIELTISKTWEPGSEVRMMNAQGGGTIEVIDRTDEELR